MEAIRSSATSVHTRSTRRHIPEDGILHEICILFTLEVDLKRAFLRGSYSLSRSWNQKFIAVFTTAHRVVHSPTVQQLGKSVTALIYPMDHQSQGKGSGKRQRKLYTEELRDLSSSSDVIS
jgi:hypothetical protein